MNVGSLFTGIGGIDRGLERAGMHIVWQCESDPYCRAVLRKHWPSVALYEDVQTLVAPERVDLLAGGFPCQDLSVAGRRAGIGGERSGLWDHFARLILELRPRYVLVENVPGLLVRGMGRVLGDLAACGYDAEWDCVPAAAIGAPHLRARIFILAYPNGGQCVESDEPVLTGRDPTAGSGQDVADSEGKSIGAGLRTDQATAIRWGRSGDSCGAGDWWATEPDVGRVAHGVSARVDRLRALGNAVVPQVAEWIGRRIMEAEAVA